MATIVECAAHLFLSEVNMHKHITFGHITKQDRDQYNLDVVRQEYIEYMRAAARGRGSPEGQLILSDERAKLTKSQRLSQEMKNSVMRGELVQVEAVGQLVEECFGNVRNRLVTIAGKLSAALADQPREYIETRLTAEINEVLTELHEPDSIAARVVAGEGQIVDDEPGEGPDGGDEGADDPTAQPRGKAQKGQPRVQAASDAQPRRMGRPKKEAG